MILTCSKTRYAQNNLFKCRLSDALNSFFDQHDEIDISKIPRWTHGFTAEKMVPNPKP
jgi:hypothetical protein